MVAQNTMRTYGVNHVIRFVEGIWLQRKSRQIYFFTLYVPTYSKLPSYIITTRTIKIVFNYTETHETLSAISSPQLKHV